jgi:hypothetical protein
MPYTMRKVPKKNCYMVVKRKTQNKNRRVTAKCSTKENATRQLRLLRAIQFGKNFVPRKSIKKRP